jgi:hypothetical protein
MRKRPRRWPVTAVVAALVVVVTATACGGEGAGSPAPGRPAVAGDPLDLRSVCPDPVVIQTSWFPESTHGGLFQLLGPKPRVDAEKKRITGRLVARGEDTGVRLEIRAGGPALGYQQVPAQLYLDKAITLGQVATEEGVAYAAEQPTLAVVAPLEIDPLVIIWDPQTHPDWNIIADIGQTDATVYSYQGAANTEYLVQSGILRRSQINGSYDGSGHGCAPSPRPGSSAPGSPAAIPGLA